MGKFRSIRNSFLGGQISKTAVGRTDLPQYQHSCEILQNVIPMCSGGVYRRPGTTYIASESSASLDAPRLFPFIVSRTESYALEFGRTESTGVAFVKSFRVTDNTSGMSNGVQTTASGSPPPYALATAITAPPYDDEIHSVQYTQSNDVMWFVHKNRKPYVVKRNAVDSFSCDFFDAGLSGLALAQAYPYLNQNATTATMAVGNKNAGTTGVTLTCSSAYFVPAHVGSIIAIQSGHLVATGGIGFAMITAVGGGGSPQTTATVTNLTGFADTSAHTTWWESAWSNYRGWPRSVCIFHQRLCMGGATPISGESIDAFGIPVGQPDTIWCSETGGYFKFTALGDSAVAGVTGVLANGQNYSTPGDFVYYPVDDSQGDGQSTGPIGIQPFRVSLADSQLDSIQWMSPDQEMLIGTLSEEWVLAPQNGSFDVANSIASIQSHYGSDYLPAVRIGYELMFPMYTQDELRAYQYNYLDQSFFAEPVQLFFDEYPQGEVGTPLEPAVPTSGTFNPGRRKYRAFSWDVTRNTLWCLDTAGNFFGMTRDRKLQVTMWHTHQFGGFNPNQGNGGGGVGTDPSYTNPDGSVCSFIVLPNPLSGINDIWLVIKRTVNSVPRWQIERMIGKNTVRNSAYSQVTPCAGIGNGSNAEPVTLDATVVPSSITDNGDGTSTVSTPGNLQGFTLTGVHYNSQWGMFQINALGPVDGSGNFKVNTAAFPPTPVGLGAVTQTVFGLPYTPIIQPVRPDLPSQIGTSQGAIKRVAKVFLRFYKTLMANCGSPPGQTTSPISIVPWTPPPEMGMSPEIYTGDKEVFIASQYDRDGYIYITQTSPLPFTLVSIVVEGADYDQ